MDHDYKVRYKVILNKHTAYKYETPYTGPFVITQYYSNGTLNLQYGPTKTRYNICCIKRYKSDTNIEDI